MGILHTMYICRSLQLCLQDQWDSQKHIHELLYIYNKTIIYILYIHTGNTVLIHKCKHMHIHDLRKVNVIS